MDRNRRSLLRSLCGLTASAALPAWSRAAIGNGASPPQPEASSIRMILGAPGLDFILRNGATGRMYQPETVLGGLGVIDYDSDGWPDLFCTNGAAMPSLEKSGPEYWNHLYRNNRDGTFTDVTEKAGLAGQGYSMGVAVGDYNNDGHEDLFVAGLHGNYLYRNNGYGTFTDVTEKAGLAGPGSLGRPAWTVAACWIDYDNDGNLDLFLSNYCDWAAGSDPLCGGLVQSERTYCHPDRYRAQAMQLFHNNGDGTFTEITCKEGFPEMLGKGMGIAFSDFAADGRAGLFIANDNARNLLLRNRGKGFAETGVEAGVAFNGDGRNISGMGTDFGDIDGDGRSDIVMTGLKNETWELFLNRGGGQFDDGSGKTGLLALSRAWSGWGCGLIDLDNDGWLDIFAACGGLDSKDLQPNRIFQNRQGRFLDVSANVGPAFSRTALHRGVAFADFDRDGRLDAAVSSINGPIELWWNRTGTATSKGASQVPNGNHWLQLHLIGTRSNRSAIGAVVLCKTKVNPGQNSNINAAFHEQSRTVSGSVGYASTSDLTVHFGLGQASHAEVEIHWPSGLVQRMNEVAADQRLVITETAR